MPFGPQDATKNLPARKVNCLRGLRDNRRELQNILAVIIQQRNDQNGSSAAHYHINALEENTQAGTYADADTAAKASFDELNSLSIALEAVDVALANACAKHGV